MELNEYQSLRDGFTTYQRPRSNEGLNYTLHGLTGEAGELSNKWKKALRTAPTMAEVQYDPMVLADELGDCLWYVSAVAMELGFTLEQIAQMNIEKLTARRAERVVVG
jgi:NTP pyrophosphatase (non-canonical NTP hydrolase)